MTQVYQCDVWRLDPPHVFNRSGEIIDVAGEVMVKVSPSHITSIGPDWHATRGAAKRSAAGRVDELIVGLVGMAAKLRAEADADDAKAGEA